MSTPELVQAIIDASRQMGLPCGTLIAVPVPAENELPVDLLESVVSSALAAAKSQAIKGSASTPFLLDKIAQQTGGASLKANVALLDNSRNRSPEARGWFRFLVENHFLFDTPQADTALDQSWDRYAAIILADLQPIDDALAQKLDEFVANAANT
mgnify:CR=1 FL=1